MEDQTMIIQPANPEVVYVPQYSPAVYGTAIALIPGYSGWDVASTSALSLGAGIFMGAARQSLLQRLSSSIEEESLLEEAQKNTGSTRKLKLGDSVA
jgi:hypothetical protein